MQYLKKNPSKLLLGAAYLYLILPFAIFCLGWLKPVFSLPLTAFCALCFVLMLRWAPTLWLPAACKKTLLYLIIAAVAVFLWVWFSGIGMFAWQNEDHTVRNAIFRMMVQRSWPIVETAPPKEFFEEPVAFVYYFGFWLLPALVGKAFGLMAGNLAQVLWAFVGIMLFYWLVLASSFKKFVLWPLALFVFFSGMDWLGKSILAGKIINVITATPHLDNWADYFQFSSFTTQLYWVYNQAIAGWLATMLIYVQKNNRCLAFIAGVTFISGTLPAVGLVPIGLYVAFRNHNSTCPKPAKFDAIGFLKGILSLENFAGAICAAVCYLFLGSNNNGQNLGSLLHILGDIWWLYALFLLCEVVVLMAFVLRYEHKNPLFYVIAALFIVLPFVRINDKADVSMRVTIPALVILFLMVANALQESAQKKARLYFAGLLAVIIIGSATAQTEIVRAVAMTNIKKDAGMPLGEEWQPMQVSWRGNFYGYTKDRLFFTLLMKKPE